MSDLVAWGVVLVAAALGSVGLYFLTRTLQSPTMRLLLRVVPPLLLLVPAPVPGYPGHWAPAFIVFFFEAVFQANGQPLGALMALAGAAVLSILGVLVAARTGRIESTSENTDN